MSKKVNKKNRVTIVTPKTSNKITNGISKHKPDLKQPLLDTNTIDVDSELVINTHAVVDSVVDAVVDAVVDVAADAAVDAVADAEVDVVAVDAVAVDAVAVDAAAVDAAAVDAAAVDAAAVDVVADAEVDVVGDDDVKASSSYCNSNRVLLGFLGSCFGIMGVIVIIGVHYKMLN